METVISKRSVQRPLHILRKFFDDLADDLAIFGKYAMNFIVVIAQSTVQNFKKLILIPLYTGMNNNHTCAAEHIVGKRVVDRTKRNYTYKLNIINVFLATLTDEFGDPIENLIDEENGGQMILPLDSDIVEQIFGWLSTNTDLPKRARRIVEEDDDDDDQNVDIFANNKITISVSCMQSYKSALLWWYTENKINIDPKINEWIDTFISGYKKTVADKKARGVMSISEGKSPITYAGFCTIVKYLMELQPHGRRNTWAEGIFGWCFLSLSWNLMARSHSVGNIMLQHIEWKEDCMIIVFAKHKGDQTGDGLSNDKHVYANPLCAESCPILAIAILIFCTPRGANVLQQQLFQGNDSEGRFQKIFGSILSSIPEHIDLGADRKDRIISF